MGLQPTSSPSPDSTQDFFRQSLRRWLPFVGLILVVHGLVLGIALHRKSYLIDDSIQYMTLAENWVETGVFSQSYAAPFVPDVQRTPGYPLFLVIAFNSPILVLILQHLLLLLSGVILYKLLREYLGRKISRWFAMLYVIQPYPLLFSSLLLSETLFVTLLLGSVLFAIRFWKSGSRTQLALSLVGICLAAYVKPVGLPLVGIWGICVAIRLLRNPKGALIPGLLTVLLPLLLLGPWMLRNQQIAGKFTLSSMGDMGMVHGRLGGLEANRRGEGFHEHYLYMAGDSIAASSLGLGELRSYYGAKENHETELYHPKIGGITLAYYFQHPIDATIFQCRAMGQMLAGVGFGWAGKVLGNQAGAYFSAGIQLLFNVLMYGGVLIALIRFRKGNPLIWGCLLCFGVVMVVSAAAWADGRYRMVIDPLLMVVAAGSFQSLFLRPKSI